MKKYIGMVFACFIASAPLAAKQCDMEEMTKRSLCGTNRYPECGHGWYADIGILIEQMRISNSQTCVLFDFNTTSPQSIVETVPYFNFEVDLGLRAVLGYDSMHDDWEVKAAFEWQASRASYQSEFPPGSSFAIAPYGIPLLEDGSEDGILFQDVKASLKVRYFLLDVMLSKGSYFSKNFSYSPFAGIKASWISYDGKFTYDDYNTSSGLVLEKNNNVDFWGVGPMAGIDSNYYVVAGWSIFSSADFSVLIGENKLNYSQDLNSTTVGVAINTNQNANVFSPTMRVNLGLQYETGGYTSTQHMVLRVGFDGRYYFNQFPIITRTNSVSPTSFSFVSDIPLVVNNGSYGMLGALVELGCYF